MTPPQDTPRLSHADVVRAQMAYDEGRAGQPLDTDGGDEELWGDYADGMEDAA